MSSSKRFKLPGSNPFKSSRQAPRIPLIIRFYDPDVQAEDTRGRTQEQILSWSNNELEACHNYIQMLFPLPEGSPFNFAAPVIDLEVMQAFRARTELRNRLKRSFERMLDFYGFKVSNLPGINDSEEQQQNDMFEKQDKDEDSKDNPSALEPVSTNPPPKEPTTTTTENSNPISKATESIMYSLQTHYSPLLTYNVIRAPHFRRASYSWARRFDHNHLRITRILRCLRVLGLQRECDTFFVALKSVYEDPAISISDRSMMYWERAVTRPLYMAPDDEEIEWLREWEESQGEQEGKRKREHGAERDE